jgi:lysophospholipase L1-like esterase
VSLVGATLFAGDSITVGYAPLASVQGEKILTAKGGISSAAVLALVRAEETRGTLARVKTMIVLAGTNDIGSTLDPAAIFGNLQAIWKIGKAHGIRVIALTIPPARGYTGWNGRDDAVDARRRAVNDKIKVSVLPDAIIDLDAMLGTTPDTGKLSPQFDGGDHLHPNFARMAQALDTKLTALPAAAPIPSGTNTAPAVPVTPAAGASSTKILVESAVVGGIAVGIWKGLKWWRGRG